MAGLAPIPASAHFRAIAYLRGRLFMNGFRRKGGTGELIARFIVYPIFAAFALGPILGAGSASYYFVHSGEPQMLGLVWWGIFFLWIVVSINISPPGLSFDPESLIRFPVSFPRYLVIRLFLGLLAASTVMGSLALVGSVIGISLANPSLFVISALSAFVFAVANILFTRMVFAWVDRWLSTRRSREVFTGLLFLFGIGVQYLNVTLNGLGKHTSHAAQARKIAAVTHFFATIRPFADWLPPGLASSAILHASQRQLPMALLGVAGVLVYAAGFLGIFAWRTQREFRGEALSDSIQIAQAPVERRSAAAPAHWTSFGLSSGVAAVLAKEFLYIRRTTSQFYGLIAPVLMVVIFAGRLGTLAKTGMAFPLGMGYSLLGLAAFPYNSLGIDQSGVQFYFLAPVRFRSILLAKNLLLFGIAAIQVALVYGVVAYATGVPPLMMTLSTVIWAVFAVLVSVSVGNIRSVVAPRKVDPGKLGRKQVSQLTGLMSVGITLATGAIGAGLYVLGEFLDRPWLPVAALAVLAGASFWVYREVLGRVDALAMSHREVMVEELCKAS